MAKEQVKGGGPSKQKGVQMDGVIIEALPNAQFFVRLENGFVALCYISGKVRRNSIKILVGDTVTAELSCYDLLKGRIIYRHRKNPSSPNSSTSNPS
jgi:translation initiation factor IF-1